MATESNGIATIKDVMYTGHFFFNVASEEELDRCPTRQEIESSVNSDYAVSGLTDYSMNQIVRYSSIKTYALTSTFIGYIDIRNYLGSGTVKTIIVYSGTTNNVFASAQPNISHQGTYTLSLRNTVPAGTTSLKATIEIHIQDYSSYIYGGIIVTINNQDYYVSYNNTSGTATYVFKFTTTRDLVDGFNSMTIAYDL